MSTFLGSKQSAEIHSEEDLIGYFQTFAKPQECMRVGLEAEFFPVFRANGQPLAYEGDVGVHALLKVLARHFKYEPVLEENLIVALKKGPSYITLEPGGQIELSAPPVKTVFEIKTLLDAFIADLKRLEEFFPQTAFLAFGIQPFSRLEDVAWVPKKRYKVMADYLGRQGKMAHQMMKLTATNQINFDYLSEEHAMASLRTVLGISPIVSALFANSCFSEGRPNGFLSKRQEIWRYTDPDRTGIPEIFLQPGKKFQDYLEYLLEIPVMFLVRSGEWQPFTGKTFRELIKEGFQGQPLTVADFELHLSTAFPEARLKQYLEVRGIDGQSPELILAVAAFWKGILYDAETREKAWTLVEKVPRSERLELYQSVPRKGLSGSLRGKPLWEYAEELVSLSCEGLAKQTTQDESRSECLFLQEIMRQILEPRKSPAEQFLENWQGQWAQDPGKVLEALRL